MQIKVLAFCLALLGLAAIGACNRPDPAGVAPAAVPAAPAAPAVAEPAKQPVAEPAPARVTVEAKKPAKKAAKKPAKKAPKADAYDENGFPKTRDAFLAMPAAERGALLRAVENVMRADCLRDVVDDKIAGDVRLGVIRDFGNVLQAPVCEFRDTLG